MLIRTRERLLLLNRVYAPHKVLNKAKESKSKEEYATLSLKNVEEDLERYVPHLDKMIGLLSTERDNLPVAFATNALYVLEKNGHGNRDHYERVLLPVLR